MGEINIVRVLVMLELEVETGGNIRGSRGSAAEGNQLRGVALMALRLAEWMPGGDLFQTAFRAARIDGLGQRRRRQRHTLSPGHHDDVLTAHASYASPYIPHQRSALDCLHLKQRH